MGYMSIWHWIIIFFVLFFPYIPVYFALKKIEARLACFINGNNLIGFIYHLFNESRMG